MTTILATIALLVSAASFWLFGVIRRWRVTSAKIRRCDRKIARLKRWGRTLHIERRKVTEKNDRIVDEILELMEAQR